MVDDHERVSIVGGDRMLEKHDFEVKYFMRPDDILNVNHTPTEYVAQTFELSDKSTDIAMQFVDGVQHELDSAHWNVRLRVFEGKNDLELTYKRRYEVVDGKIDRALADATADGFVSDEHHYDAQVEWGSKKQTLSVSRRKTIDTTGGRELPTETRSRTMCTAEVPDIL